jgi:hypothetical protein
MKVVKYKKYSNLLEIFLCKKSHKFKIDENMNNLFM